MAVHTGQLRLETRGDADVVDITEGVQAVLRTSGVEVGTVVAFVTGSTAALTTMEYEPGGVSDLRALLDTLVPARPDWLHNERNNDTNAHAHLRAALIGPSETVPVVGGRLVLGTWQQIVLVDFDDRPRQRVVTVQVHG
jgi:secondary thiamine-phosphate synthase enzyme